MPRKQLKQLSPASTRATFLYCTAPLSRGNRPAPHLNAPLQLHELARLGRRLLLQAAVLALCRQGSLLHLCNISLPLALLLAPGRKGKGVVSNSSMCAMAAGCLPSSSRLRARISKAVHV